MTAVNGHIRIGLLSPVRSREYPFTAEEEEILARERVTPCHGCTHLMRDHDEDDRCTLCDCGEFSYESEPEDA